MLDFQPNYFDRHMSSNAKFGDLGEIKDTDECVALQPNSATLKSIIAFACVFLPAFIYLAWRFIDGPEKWFAIIMGPICGGIAFGGIYWITKQNVDKGAYIQFDRKTNKLSLPRLNCEFDSTEIECLQLITGRSKTLPDVQMNLNLIVRENETLFRYLVMPSPYRQYVLKFAKLCDFEVREVTLGPNANRDASLNDSANDG